MDAGGLRLTVAWDGARIAAARVASTRTPAARVLCGRDAAEAAALVPRLFSLCGRAQGLAARLALAAACGEAVEAPAEQRAVAIEAIGEHLWRLCLDWPLLADAASQPAAAGPAKNTPTAAHADFRRWRQRLLTAAPTDDAALADELEAALPSLVPAGVGGEVAQFAAPLLPFVAAADWARTPLDETFAAAPTWHGQPAETGPLARWPDDAAVAAELAAGRRIAARLAARIADLRRLAAALRRPELLAGWNGSTMPAPGVGLSRVETARGLLLHLTHVNDGRVARYVIVAPTEWNFHPQGAFAGEIVGSPAATRDAAARLARRLALSLDPCVAYEVVVEDA